MNVGGLGASDLISFKRRDSGNVLVAINAGNDGGNGWPFSGFRLNNIGTVTWTGTTSAYGAIDLAITRDGQANTLAQRNGANGQTFRVYGNYLTSSDYRRLNVSMSLAGVASIKPEDGGAYVGSTVLHISGLPTSNPGPGILWNNGGVVNVGT